MSVHELHNYIILPVSLCVFHGARNEYGIVFIGDAYLINYIPKHVKSIIKTNKIECGCETCISDMLLQSEFNKWELT